MDSFTPLQPLRMSKNIQLFAKIGAFLYAFKNLRSQLYPIGRAIPFFDLWNDKSLQKIPKISPFCQDL